MNATLEFRQQFATAKIVGVVNSGRYRVFRVRTQTRISIGEMCHLTDFEGRKMECFVLSSENEAHEWVLSLRTLNQKAFT